MWEIRVLEANKPACQFWARTIDAFLGEPNSSVAVEKDGKSWRVFSFESVGA